MSALDFDLDSLIDTAVTEAQVEDGLTPALIMKRAEKAGVSLRNTAVLVAANASQGNANGAGYGGGTEWTEAEDQFLRDNLGKLSMDEIAEALGRTENAIKVHWTRGDFQAPSKQGGELVANAVAEILGKCSKSVGKMIDLGILPGRMLPGEKGIRVVTEWDFRRWAVNPMNWIYFNHDKVTDPKLRRLLDLRRERWTDAWMTPGQVAQMHRVDVRAVNKAIHDGRLPAKRWYNWNILRSNAEQITFVTGKGMGSTIEWSEAADAFMILATAVGLYPIQIERMMKIKDGHHYYRMGTLAKNGRIPELIKKYELAIFTDERGRLWTDWYVYRSRFPAVVRAIEAYQTKRPLTIEQRKLVLGVMRSWLGWFAQADEQEAFYRRVRLRGNPSVKYLDKVYNQLCEWAIVPWL